MTLEANIRKWLTKVGYPFELEAGRALRDAGWEVEQGHLYRDPLEDKTREIDVYARLAVGSRDPPVAAKVSLAVECKSSTDKPWIIFTSYQTGPLAGIESQRVPGFLAG